MQTIEDIVARSELHDVAARFCRGADRLDRDMILSAYHPDAWDDHGSFAGTPEPLADWIIELHSTQFLWTAHYISNELVELDGDRAHGEIHVQGLFRFERDGDLYDMMGFGRYIDRYERRDGVWRIIHRVATADWNRIDRVGERPDGALVKQLVPGTRTLDDPSYTVFRKP